MKPFQNDGVLGLVFKTIIFLKFILLLLQHNIPKTGRESFIISSKIYSTCSGQDAQLWFCASIKLDKDQEFLNGVDPELDDINISVNLTNFKLPSKEKYICKIGFQTYIFGDLLLLNLSKNDIAALE